ncbi:MAG: MFS transporter [Novosphingobium sp.]
MRLNSDPRSAAALATLWTVVFVDLIGFGILAPLVPFYALRTGLGAEMVTLVIAAYSLSQFVAMPVWGHISDHYGRRPVLLASMAGHALSYVLLAQADSWQMLLLARVLGGITSANLATAYAYVTDVTAPEERARHLGRLSAAFGMGFVIGPMLGGLLSGSGGIEQANFALPAYAAAALSALSFLGILFLLPESNRTGTEEAPRSKASMLASLASLRRQPRLAGLVSLCLIVITFVAAREAILAIWAHDVHGLGPRYIGLVLGVSGATIALFQFAAMGPLAKRFSSYTLVKAAILLYAAGWLGLLLATTWLNIALAVLVAAIATALFQTNMQTLISEQALPSERGLAMGVYQSSSSMARFIGQAGVGTVYAFVSPSAPFALGVLMMIPALLLLGWTRRADRQAMELAE